MVEREPKFEQQTAFDDASGETLVAGVPADCAEQYRLVLRQRCEGFVRQDLARGEVVVSAERIFGRTNVSGIPHGRPQDFEGFGGYFGSDSISWNHRNVECSNHRFSLQFHYVNRLHHRGVDFLGDPG